MTMDVKTFRAKSMQQALSLVRSELGPDAAVLHTRQVTQGMLGWLGLGRRIEVTASSSVNVPSRLPAEEKNNQQVSSVTKDVARKDRGGLDLNQYNARAHDELNGKINKLYSLVEQIYDNKQSSPQSEMSETYFQLFTDLIEAEVTEELARELLDKARDDSNPTNDPVLLKARLSRLVEEEIGTTGPIQVTPGKLRIVALVGPTGVGKTTTIAKLAANYRLREKVKVGLITVDTYRIAAVEQLRTYADIMDLPMEVVSTPKEMRDAIKNLSDLDLIFMDTAGRSPRDDIRIQELKSMLAEAGADEVHLVLSSVASANNLAKTASQFTAVGTTSLILTKLDEASSYGNILPLLRSCYLPLSYITNGQNVPDDIQVAGQQQLAKMVLGMEATNQPV